jgi:Ca-activated chloride channel homolog
MKYRVKTILTIILFTWIYFIPSASAWGQEEKEMSRILFMLDGSQSMSTKWGNMQKISVAKQVLSEIIDSLKDVPNVQMALRAYGHQDHYTLNNCKDTKLEVGFRAKNQYLLQARLREIKPNGITPIAYSLGKAANDFPKDPDARNIVIIITDGEESCDGDPCLVSRELQKKNLILKPFVIGLGYQSELRTNLDCIGAYYEANTPKEFRRLMKNIVIRVLDKTSVQVELLDIFSNPTETDVMMSFFNPISGVSQYNYYHTINQRGEPDTLDIDPINNYDLIIHTIPPIVKKDLYFKANEHNVVKIPAPQGYLNMIMQNSNTRYNANIDCIIQEKTSGNTVHFQKINSKLKYLTGNYDLEILSLPRIKLDNVVINQSETTTIQIPEPGLVTLNSRIEIYGGIFRVNENKTEKIYQLNDRILKESILLQPGYYIVVYRSKLRRNANASETKNFRVKSGESITLNL